jgi:hypothetical protein
MKVIKITDNIIQLHFKSQEELAKTFCRFQEHYESPNDNFRNKTFTLGEYRAWYAKTYGAWTYYTDWNGFNIPSRVLFPFQLGLFDPLLPEETKLLELFSNRDDEFYVIGTYDGHKEAIGHEICHALWYLDENYRHSARRFVNEIQDDDIYKKIEKWLLDQGYCEAVMKDEINAYLAHYPEHCEKKFGLPKNYEKLIDLKKAYFRIHNIDEGG